MRWGFGNGGGAGAPEPSEEVTGLGRHSRPERGFTGGTELDSDPESLVPVPPPSDQTGDVS